MARQILSIVAKNENSTEHFVSFHADYLTPWGPKNNNCGIEYVPGPCLVAARSQRGLLETPPRWHATIYCRDPPPHKFCMGTDS